MNRFNLYLNLLACCLFVVIGMFMIAVSFILGGVLGGLFAITIGFVPIAAFTKEIYELIKESET